MKELLTIDGAGKAKLHLHKGQREAWKSRRRFVFIIAGTQSGKTSFGPWYLANKIDKLGDGDYLAVTSTYDLFKLKMLPEMLRVFTGYLSNDGWKWSASERVIANGNKRIILRSADAEGGLESATAKFAWLDECGQDRFTLGAWEAIQRRLSLAEGGVLGTTTPYNLGWLKTEIFDRWRAGDENYQVIQFSSLMNPKFPKAEYERMKDILPAWKFNMFYNGQFERPAGMIYADFSDEENLCDPFDIPSDWPVYVAIDFGAVNTATVWIARNPQTNVLYLYQETLEGNMTTKQHATKALDRAKEHNIVGWSGGAKSETQQRMDWTAAGVPIKEPLVDDVEGGIDRVNAEIKTRRLRVFRTLAGIRDEIGRYARELDSSGQPTEKIADKATFHRLDALRYCIISITNRHWLAA